jgi:hypothetical protein
MSVRSKGDKDRRDSLSRRSAGTRPRLGSRLVGTRRKPDCRSVGHTQPAFPLDGLGVVAPPEPLAALGDPECGPRSGDVTKKMTAATSSSESALRPMARTRRPRRKRIFPTYPLPALCLMLLHRFLQWSGYVFGVSNSARRA